MVVFVTQKKHLPKILLWVGLDLRDTIQDGSLEVELHHHAEGLCQPRVHNCWEIERAQLAVFD
jgi:hypothetical protein